MKKSPTFSAPPVTAVEIVSVPFFSPLPTDSNSVRCVCSSSWWSLKDACTLRSARRKLSSSALRGVGAGQLGSGYGAAGRRRRPEPCPLPEPVPLAAPGV